jgi:plastocyanin
MCVGAAAGALALAGCGGGGGGSSSGSSGSSGSSSGSGASSGSSNGGGGGGSQIRLAADPSGKLAFDKKTLSAKSGQVTIGFTNASSEPHAVAIQGKGSSKVITKGKATLTAQLKPGKYVFYCPVPGHRAAGMEGTLTVK